MLVIYPIDHYLKKLGLVRWLRRFADRLVSLFVVGCALSACQPEPLEVVTRLAPIQQIPLPAGDYIHVAWLIGDQLVVTYDPDPRARNPGSDLWIMQADGGDLRRMDLPQDEDYTCLVTFFHFPVKLPDGRLAFERECSTKQGAHVNIVAWDPQTQASEHLYGYELPTGAVSFTFAPDMSRGIMAPNTGIADELYWLDAQTYSPLDVGLARANKPAWSPDGQSIVFFGNRSMPGLPGPHWANQPRDLWLMPANCEGGQGGCVDDLRLLISNIRAPSAGKWSPDGHWLVFDGDLHDHGLGIWLMSVDTGVVFQVAVGDYRWPEWSPDGQRLVVLGPPEALRSGEVPHHRPALYIVDVSEVVSESVSSTP